MRAETSDYTFRPLEADVPASAKKPAVPVRSGAGEEPGAVLPDGDAGESAADGGEDASEEAVPATREEPVESEAERTIRFAQVQAQAIVEDARLEGQELKDQMRAEAESEAEDIRSKAREEGYAHGYAEGMAEAGHEAKLARDRQALEETEEIAKFLEDAYDEKVRLLDDAREDLKNMAIAIAEKVIRISLRGSSDILLKMVDAATDTHKKSEWAHIYIADCDIKGKARTLPELTAALSHVSERVKIIPMADDESGTCIVELPDVILDASVSTQLGNIREALADVSMDE